MSEAQCGPVLFALGRSRNRSLAHASGEEDWSEFRAEMLSLYLQKLDPHFLIARRVSEGVLHGK